jgi:hypothetical protein
MGGFADGYPMLVFDNRVNRYLGKSVACPRLPWACCRILTDSHAHDERGHATEYDYL